MTDGIRVLGFLILAISFVIEGTMIEGNIEKFGILELVLRSVGYLGVFVGICCENVQDKPKSKREIVRAIAPISIPTYVWLGVIPVVLTAMISVFYVRKAIFGLEAHVKPVAIAFTLFCLAQFLSLACFLQASPQIMLFTLFHPYGAVWSVELLLYGIAALILGRWVFGYLLKQFETQLFMILSLLIVVIFLVTAVTFTGLLLGNIQTESMRQLMHDAKVLQYALDTKREASIADAQVLAQNPVVLSASQQASRSGELTIQAEQFLLSKQHSYVVITDANGQIIARGDDAQKIGDSISSDTMFRRAKDGNVSSTIVTSAGVLAPVVSLRAAAPIMADKKVVGTVIIGTAIDNAFVDGIRTATGLEASVYGDFTVSATTLVESDGTTRLVGTKAVDSAIKERVLHLGETFSGSTTIGSTAYSAVFVPLVDVDTNPVGMLFVGRPQAVVMQAASHSIELTFIATSILVMLSLVPSYLIARSIANQL